MPESPFVVDKFSGLDLYNDPQELGPSTAVDLLNADLDQRGRVRARDGSSALSAAAASNQTAMTYFNSGLLAGGLEWIVTADASTLRPYKLSNGTTSTTQAGVVTSNNGFVRFGDPSTIRLFAAVASTTMPYATESIGVIAWSTFVAPIGADLVAVTANDNRLVLADSGALASYLYFSDAGAPTTFGVNNFVDLWPGDGETIKGLVRWRDYLFAFKQTKFAVFTGTSTDSTGNPIFNYRSVDAGRGVGAVGQAVAGEEGVYFADAAGIYLTTGDKATYISQPIEPWLKTGSFGSLPSFSLSAAKLVYHNRRLYVVYANGANSVTLVFDPTLDAWFVWQLGATAACSVPSSSTLTGLYFGEFTSKKVAKMDSSVATDLGSAYSWSWTSAPYDLGYQAQVKITSESRLWGLGTVTLKVANDYGAFDTGSALTLGTSPTVADAWQQIDREGTLWQHKLSGTGAATVSRLAHYVSFVKPVGVG